MGDEHRAGAVTSPLQGLCAPQANSSSKSVIKLLFLNKSRPGLGCCGGAEELCSPWGSVSSQPYLAPGEPPWESWPAALLG